ncbi:hypothetical protein BDQ17DRAFT_1254693, partial [Cyathus striatus]
RICPGKYLADGSLWLAMSSMVACFIVAHAFDDNGNKIIPEDERMTGLTSRLKPFKCIINPRDETTRQMLNEVKHSHL